MRKMMLFLGGVACVAAAWAQDYQKTAYGVKATVNAVDVEVQFFTPSVVRILKSPHGESFEKKSLSVVASPGEVGFKISVKKGDIVLGTKELQVSLDLSLIHISEPTRPY